MVKAVRNYLKLLPPSAQIVALMLGLVLCIVGAIALISAYPGAAFVAFVASGVGYVLFLFALILKMTWLDD